MKKKLNLLAFIGIVIVLLGIVVFLIPIGTGVVRSITNPSTGVVSKEFYSGYDVIFGNKSISGLSSSTAFIAAFTLLIIGIVFQAIAAALCVPNPEGSKKFSGFLFFVGGLAEIVTGIVYLLATKLAPLPSASNVSYGLGWSLLAAAVAALVGALLSLVFGVIALRRKGK